MKLPKFSIDCRLRWIDAQHNESLAHLRQAISAAKYSGEDDRRQLQKKLMHLTQTAHAQHKMYHCLVLLQDNPSDGVRLDALVYMTGASPLGLACAWDAHYHQLKEEECLLLMGVKRLRQEAAMESIDQGYVWRQMSRALPALTGSKSREMRICEHQLQIVRAGLLNIVKSVNESDRPAIAATRLKIWREIHADGVRDAMMVEPHLLVREAQDYIQKLKMDRRLTSRNLPLPDVQEIPLGNYAD